MYAVWHVVGMLHLSSATGVLASRLVTSSQVRHRGPGGSMSTSMVSPEASPAASHGCSRSSPYKEWVSVVGLSGQAMPWSWGWGHLPESGKRLVVTHCHCYRTVLQVVWFCSPELLLNQAVSPWSPQGRKALKGPCGLSRRAQQSGCSGPVGYLREARRSQVQLEKPYLRGVSRCA